jgi:putative ABC transport system permease protein
MASGLIPSKLNFTDLARTATIGMRTRKQRAALSALGIMIGIGAMVAVLGLSQSSQAELLAQLERLGTNLITVQPDSGFGLGSGNLPAESTSMISRIGPVEETSMISVVSKNVYRNDLIPVIPSAGNRVMDPQL